jgi:hypothetical protein
MIRTALVAVLVVAVACTSAGSAGHSSSTPAAPPHLMAWTYEGVVRQNSVDNRSVVLPDGGYRQVFSSWRSFVPGPNRLPGQDPHYVTAVSSDGLHWTNEGESPIGYYVPVRLPDGTYRAFASGRLYTSTDAKNWTLIGQVVAPEAGNPTCGNTSGMFSDFLTLPNSALRAYYNCVVDTYFNIKATEIKSATSKDGLHWTIDPGVRINPLDGPEIPRGADGQVNGPGAAEHPRVFTLPDGTFKMFYSSLNLCCLWSATSLDGLTWTNRKPENVHAGDPDVIVLADGRIRVFANGGGWLPADGAGHSLGENWSRTVSYVYGPTSYRLSLPKPLPVVPGVIAPTHLPVVIEGSGHSVTFDAFAYAGVGGTSTYDLVDGSYQPVRVDYHGSYDPVKVVFQPASSKPPFTADAVFNWTVDPLDQAYVLSFGTLIVADDGSTKQVVTVNYAWTATSPASNCGPGTGTPCPPTNCGPATGTPCPPSSNCGPGTGTQCPPTNCGPGTDTPCIQPSQGPCTPGTACPGTPDNCGPGQQFACPSPAIACQKGQPIPSKGCVTGGYDGKPKLCLPHFVDPNPPVICQEFY